MTTSKIESRTEEISTFLGMRNRVLISADETDGAFSAIEITVQPQVGPPLHTNTREALGYYGLEGVLSFVTEAGERELRPGGFVYLRKGGTHTFANKGDAPARALLIASPGGFERFFADAAAVFPAEPPDGPPPPELIAKLAEVSAKHGMSLVL